MTNIKNDFIEMQYRSTDTVLQNTCSTILFDIVGKYMCNSEIYSKTETVDLWLYHI